MEAITVVSFLASDSKYFDTVEKQILFSNSFVSSFITSAQTLLVSSAEVFQTPPEAQWLLSYSRHLQKETLDQSPGTPLKRDPCF